MLVRLIYPGSLHYGLKLRSKKSTKAHAFAVAARPVGNTAHRSRGGRLHSDSTSRTAPQHPFGCDGQPDMGEHRGSDAFGRGHLQSTLDLDRSVRAVAPERPDAAFAQQINDASSTGRETPQPLVSLWTEPKLIQAAGCIEVFTLPFAANALDHPPRPSMAATRATTTWPQGRVGGLVQSALIISRLVRRLPSLAGAHQSVHHHRPLSDSRRRGPPALQRHLGRT